MFTFPAVASNVSETTRKAGAGAGLCLAATVIDTAVAEFGNGINLTCPTRTVLDLTTELLFAVL
ncbi:hypothetical protein SAMN05444972_1226 [Marininema halotolerans]|uniref:Uncharacterized protein n=2 Tax=Marininema halotolerans TaxID=1155944 RepID=A0A1I6UUS7_9BACL|nr:hypothetical protein SAMN05444972_1226 [Marininema halotolerans]